MLVELAAANAAFAVIKEAIANGGEIASYGAKLGEYFGLKAEIAKKANTKGSDSEEFWALEAIRNQEEELKQMMIYQGRAGLWNDWLAFQAQKKRERDQAEKERVLAIYRRKQKVWAWINSILISISVLSGLVVIAGLIWVIVKRGNF
ncbi:hypothetical protein [Shewanella sp.]|uniref:hypothetical protein n=1 Tax=Shewanella sp. TaxID=50422 RepID=UPI004047330F